MRRLRVAVAAAGGARGQPGRWWPAAAASLNCGGGGLQHTPGAVVQQQRGLATDRPKKKAARTRTKEAGASTPSSDLDAAGEGATSQVVASSSKKTTKKRKGLLESVGAAAKGPDGGVGEFTLLFEEWKSSAAAAATSEGSTSLSSSSTSSAGRSRSRRSSEAKRATTPTSSVPSTHAATPTITPPAAPHQHEPAAVAVETSDVIAAMAETQSAKREASAHRAKGAEAAAAAAAAKAEQAATEEVKGLEELVKRAGRELGLGPRADDELRAVATRLHDNWFHAPADLAHLTHEDAARLRVPLRLYQELVRMSSQAPHAPVSVSAPSPPSSLLPGVSDAASSTPPASPTAHMPAASKRAARGRLRTGGKEKAKKSEETEPEVMNVTLKSETKSAWVQSEAIASVETDPVTIEAKEETEIKTKTKTARVKTPRQMLSRTSAMSLGRGSAAMVRLVERKKNTDRTPYGLRADEIGPALAAQLAGFRRFLTTKFYGQQESPVGLETAEMYQKHVLLLLGWLWRHHREAGHASALPAKVQELTLECLFPSSSRESASVVYEFSHWLVTVRGCGPGGELKSLHSLVALAKFLFHKQSKVDPAEGDKSYSDIGLVRELRKLANDAAARTKTAPKVANERAKWLDWPEYLRCVELLQSECAQRDKLGHLRSPSAIAHSFQLYLMFSILSCVPDRQRTLRELEVGKTLFKTEDDGDVRWEIRHGPGDYKTGKIYGERPPLLIAPHIYPFLEEYLAKWRPYLNPDHNFVFSKKNGGRPDAKWVYAVFSTAAFRLTGKRTNPHLIRDMIVTFLRDTDASERELEALAIYMGHSLKMQKTTYDRRTKQQKVAPAVQLIHSIKAGSAPFPSPATAAAAAKRAVDKSSSTD